ncbi:MAG: prolipoprotein diacylglyceryl transferase family protein [Patescibacteria group bacterium]
MWPSLISIGSFSVSSFGIFVALGFILAAFGVWRESRDRGLEEIRILDNIVVAAVSAFIGARILFIVVHWPVFSEQLLRIFVLWRFPGFSVIGAIISGSIAFLVYGKSQKLSLMTLIDAYGKALPPLIFFVSLAVFLDGSVTGKVLSGRFGVPAVGVPGLHHPIGLYGMIASLGIWLILWVYNRNVSKYELPRGSSGLGAFLLLGITLCVLAIFRQDHLYWNGISADLLAFVTIALISLVGLVIVIDNKYHNLRNLTTIFQKKKI